MNAVMFQILDTFLLRRVKEEVELNLPPKKEILVYCKMSEQQLCLYHSTVDRTINRLVSKLVRLHFYCCLVCTTLLPIHISKKLFHRDMLISLYNLQDQM